jgi:hypothetical protein
MLQLTFDIIQIIGSADDINSSGNIVSSGIVKVCTDPV